ncbi:MAG: mycothiol system anti-sigma-R factor [Actinomycetota bacterium]|nr:mycothiol system anti-sigma-R factor [Actinomycetota bacterium]
MGTDHYNNDSMECKDVLARLYTFLDGELTEERRIRIRRHLDECSPCLEAYEFEAELRQMVANRLRDRVPDMLRSKISRLIEMDSQGTN